MSPDQQSICASSKLSGQVVHDDGDEEMLFREEVLGAVEAFENRGETCHFLSVHG